MVFGRRMWKARGRRRRGFEGALLICDGFLRWQFFPLLKAAEGRRTPGCWRAAPGFGIRGAKREDTFSNPTSPWPSAPLRGGEGEKFAPSGGLPSISVAPSLMLGLAFWFGIPQTWALDD